MSDSYLLETSPVSSVMRDEQVSAEQISKKKSGKFSARFRVSQFQWVQATFMLRLKARRQAIGLSLGENDLWIAATAIRSGCKPGDN